MKLSKHFLRHNVDGEVLLVSVGGTDFSGVVRGNKTLSVLLELLASETTQAELVAAMKRRFDAPEGAIERDVSRALGELRRIGALDELPA